MKITVSPCCDPRATQLVRDLIEKATERGDYVVHVATHNGKFHADELLAIAMLKYAIKQATCWSSQKIEFDIIRTRDAKKISAADIAIDVGDGPFDHHSTDDRYPNGVPMASCGKVLAAVESDKRFIQLFNSWTLYALQAVDNGDKSSKFTNNFFNWVGLMNQTYSEAKAADYNNDKPFMLALQMVEILYQRMYREAKEHLLAQGYLQHCARHFSQQILELPGSNVPWKYFVAYQLPTIKGILSQDKSTGKWTVRWVPKYMGSPDTKLHWPAEWRSKKEACEGNTTLAAKKYEFGCSFCHKSLVLANFDTRDHALQAAWFMLHKEKFV